MSLADYGINEANINMIFIFAVAAIVVLLVFSLFLRSLKGLSLYDILRRQGNIRAWYSFVPIFSDLALDMAASGERKAGILGKLNAFLTVCSFCLSTVSVILGGLGLSRLIFAADEAYNSGKNSISASEYNLLAIALYVFIAFFAFCLIKHLLKTVCLRKIYASFKANAVIYTVLGFLLPFLSPLFLRFVSTKEVEQDDKDSFFTEQGY
ncbi:MAG: hypothetical protein E7562_07330 [Ruminococcaceae bacterium]|nr:hypothetical protein [Oscillospiraceae bacterium]